jgi:hypothetical protein
MFISNLQIINLKDEECQHFSSAFWFYTSFPDSPNTLVIADLQHWAWQNNKIYEYYACNLSINITVLS